MSNSPWIILFLSIYCRHLFASMDGGRADRNAERVRYGQICHNSAQISVCLPSDDGMLCRVFILLEWCSDILCGHTMITNGACSHVSFDKSTKSRRERERDRAAYNHLSIRIHAFCHCWTIRRFNWLSGDDWWTPNPCWSTMNVVFVRESEHDILDCILEE